VGNLASENAIVRLTLMSSTLYDVAVFVLPVAGSEPYDIATAAGKVWVTERTGNRIGSFDMAASTWMEYPIPTTNSEPTGITVVPGDPTDVWFAERAGNRLGRLRVSNTGSATIDEYELPLANAYPESVSARASEPVWVSAPGASAIFRFKPSLLPDMQKAFEAWPAGSDSQPWDLKVGADGRPWLTEPQGNRVGGFVLGTLWNFIWYPLPVLNSVPYSLDIAHEAIWFTEKDGNRVGQLHPSPPYRLREFALAGAGPTGIAVDATGCAWVAASSGNALISWCPPYFHSTFLSLVTKNT
jgi:streptogramin lyase